MPPKPRKRENPERSQRCEEHIRKHEKCPYDCPRRRCKYHANLMEKCSPGCEYRKQEIEQKRLELIAEMEKKRLEYQMQGIEVGPDGNPILPPEAVVAASSSTVSLPSIVPKVVVPSVPVIPQPVVTPPIAPTKLTLPDELLIKPIDSLQATDTLPSPQYEDEELVPIRIDIMVDNHKVTDAFTWNLYDHSITPEQYSESFCRDMDLPEKVESFIAQAIRRQLKEYKDIRFASEQGECIFLIKLDLAISGMSLVDQFEWDINNPLNSPEYFAKSLCADMGLSREFEVAIAHSIREQIAFFKRTLSERGKLTDLKAYHRAVPIDRGVRDEDELPYFTPIIAPGMISTGSVIINIGDTQQSRSTRRAVEQQVAPKTAYDLIRKKARKHARIKKAKIDHKLEEERAKLLKNIKKIKINAPKPPEEKKTVIAEVAPDFPETAKSQVILNEESNHSLISEDSRGPTSEMDE